MAPTPREIGVHSRPLSETTMETIGGDKVVISGISGLFPSSDNTTQFSENLFNNVDMVTENDLNFHHPETPRHFGKISGVDKFDAQFFRVMFTQASKMEPMSRLLLEQAYTAMYDSGTNPLAYRGKKVGVFVGSSYSDTSNVAMFNGGKETGQALSGCAKTMFANRISYWIDAKGPSYAIDCSCTSSMMGLDHAFTTMTKGHCDAAIVAGCNLCLEPILGLNLKRAGFTSIDGKTRCFDKNAGGAVRAEAVCCLFLQKAQDAKRIYTELVHSKVTYGLKENAELLPLRQPEDMEIFYKDFYETAGVSPKEVEYVEADGAAIKEADANELKSLSQVFAKDKPIKVGSVKSNMGNSEAASGVIAIAKICMAYHKGKLPANLHYSEPLDLPEVNEGRIQIVKTNESFERGYTAVNNFSFTGNNCHALLKGHFKRKDALKYQSSIPRLVVISGRQEEAVENIFNILENQPIDPEVIGMLHNIYKIDTTGHMARGYTILDTNENKETVSLGHNAKYYDGTKRPLWLVFSGMGSQWPGMAADLMRIPVFAAAIHRCHNALEPYGVDLIRVLTDHDKTIFDNILNCFIGISAVQIGLTDVLKAIDVIPDNYLGHSQGEMGCCYFDECFTLEEAILAAYSRGVASLEGSFIKGAMVAVGLGYKNVLPILPPEIDVACHNSDESATLSGPVDILKKLMIDLTAKGIFNREVPSASIPFHSRYMKHAGQTFSEKLRGILKEPKLRSQKWICTSVPQNRWNEDLAKYSSPEYHTNNLLSPVYFEEAAGLIPSNAVVVEVAPHGLLQSILKRSHPECTHISLTKRGQTDQVKFLFEAIGQIYQEGSAFKMDALYPKIEYPVSTETQMISHFVKWEHSETWPASMNNKFDAVTSSTRDFFMSIHDDEYKYLSGHVRNGNKVFPEAAILFYVWETLSMYKGINHNDMSVVFREIQFHSETIIDEENILKLTFALNKGNDYFEVTNDGILLASGYIAEVAKPTFNALKDEEIINKDEEIVLNTDDVYKYLHTKELLYKGEFQSIQAFNYKRNFGQVKWNQNWITFIDSLIQLNVLARDFDGISVPKLIKKLTISVEHHEKEDTIQIDNETLYNAKVYKTCEITRCGGTEIRNIIFEDKRIRKQDPHILQSQTFIPHCKEVNVNIETGLHVILQIVAENTQNEIIRVTELESDSCSSLCDIIQEVADSIPEIDVEIDGVRVDKLHEFVGSSNLVVFQDVRKNVKLIYDVINALNKNTFILTFDQNLSEFKNGSFTVVSTMKVQGKELILLKKKCSRDDVTFISIKNDESFSWVPKLEQELRKSGRVVLISEKRQNCGLFGFVKNLARKYPSKIALFIVDDCQAPEFNKDDPAFKSQIMKNLTFNILQKGQWGSYYYLPAVANAEVNNIKLLSSSSGSIDGLKWTEVPTSPASKTTVQVYYAGASMKDSQKAVGLIESNIDGFGLDFSGFNSIGEQVMGLIPGGSLANTVEADPDLIWPVPKHWSLEEAATVPLPYVHALYCLVIKGQVLKGQTVFVNGGAGALGQAVISICLYLNCTIFTSVSDIHKKKLLLQLFPRLDERNIGCSNNGDFSNLVLINTKGNGCDFVINCGSGTSREAAMKCVAELGLFLDVNFHDRSKNEPFGMAFITGERNYLAVNLSTIFKTENREEKKKLQWIIAQNIKNGAVRPLTRTVFPLTDVTRAFRLLSLNKNRGRVLIRIGDAEVTRKCFHLLPRITYSSKGTYVVICDKTHLGVELANRLVRRGARKLILHHKLKTTSGYLNLKLATWSKHGASVKALSDSLDSDQKCVELLNDAEKMGRVQGIYIIQESSTDRESWAQQDFINDYCKISSLVANLDVVSRNNCRELSTFAVISRTSQNLVDNYMTSVSDGICDKRLNFGLPAISFKIQLDDLQSFENKIDKFEPQTITTVLNALETSIKQKQSITRTFNIKKRRHTEFLEKVSFCLGVNNLNHEDQTLTVGKFITNDVVIEELKSIIKDTCKIEYIADNLKNMTITKLKTLTHADKKMNNKVKNGLGTFYTFVDHDECAATDVIVPMKTLLNQNTMLRDLDENEPHLLMIPGFEGHHRIFESICERLKINAMTFQLGPDGSVNSVKEMALHILKHIKRAFVFKSKFYLLGYSFGVNVALEIAALLEEEGHEGIVYCLDSSPDALRIQLDAYLGNLTDNQLQNIIVEHMFSLMSGQKSNELIEDIVKVDNWSDKVNLCIKILKSFANYSAEYTQNVLDSAYRRIRLAKEYKVEFKLNSQLVLIKGIPNPKSEIMEMDYGLSKYSTKPVTVFEITSDHETAPQDCKISNIVNKFLEEEVLEKYRNRNLCEIYYSTK